jgi:hypothetical protein
MGNWKEDGDRRKEMVALRGLRQRWKRRGGIICRGTQNGAGRGRRICGCVQRTGTAATREGERKQRGRGANEEKRTRTEDIPYNIFHTHAYHALKRHLPQTLPFFVYRSDVVGCGHGDRARGLIDGDGNRSGNVVDSMDVDQKT